MNNLFFLNRTNKSFKKNKKNRDNKLPNHQFSLPIWYISPAKITSFFLIAILFIILGNLLEKITINWLNSWSTIQFSTHFFVFDKEGNIPALYSTFSLGFCSLLLTIIATVKKSVKSESTKFWRVLSFIFLFLAIDETCSIHEGLIPILRTAFNTKGLLFFPWVIPAAILLVIFLITFRRFIANLPLIVRNLFLLAGAIYVSGAIGMELIGGYIADVHGFNTKAYWLASTTEELLEMFGIVVFIYGLLSYLKSQLTELNFTVYFHQPKRLR